MYQGEQVDVRERVKHYLPRDFQAAGTVWGFGCAEGYDEIFIARTFGTRAVIGFDVDRQAIEVAKRNAWEDGVYEAVSFVCMDVNTLFMLGIHTPTRLDVLLALSVARWIGPKELAGLVSRFRPSVIYFETHGENDQWSCMFMDDERIRDMYTKEELTRLPYTKEDPRLLRTLYRMVRNA